MRGITIAVFFTVCIVAAFAAPNPNNKKITKNVAAQISGSDGVEESIYPSGRTRPVSSTRRGGIVNHPSGSGSQGQGPYLFFREPKAIGNSDWNRGGVSPTANNAWPKYRIQRGRDDEEESDEEVDEEDDDEEADDVGDDDDGSDEDDVAFDTPSWDDIYPKEETGPYARRNHPSVGGSGGDVSYVSHQPQSQSVDGSYSLSPGSPGGPSSSYQGRSEFNGRPPRNWNWGPRSFGENRRRGPVYIRVPKQSYYGNQEYEGPWYGGQRQSQNGHSRWTQWAGAGVNSGRPVATYYQPQSQSRPQYVRRSWNWRPTRPVQVESDEDDSGEIEQRPQPQVWSGPVGQVGQGQGPRHVKNWARYKSQSWGPGRQAQKFGYY